MIRSCFLALVLAVGFAGTANAQDPFYFVRQNLGLKHQQQNTLLGAAQGQETQLLRLQIVNLRERTPPTPFNLQRLDAIEANAWIQLRAKHDLQWQIVRVAQQREWDYLAYQERLFWLRVRGW